MRPFCSVMVTWPRRANLGISPSDQSTEMHCGFLEEDVMENSFQRVRCKLTKCVHCALIYCHEPERFGQILRSAGRLLAFCLTPNGSLFKQEHMACGPARSETGDECALYQKHGTPDSKKQSRCLEIQQTINPSPTSPALPTRQPAHSFFIGIGWNTTGCGLHSASVLQLVQQAQFDPRVSFDG